ncbi:MAG: endonuclease/exonuclease/phosphatase [Acidimicrobiales bacterium]|nr:endonuclease/exonuclease/phosphatase [Acidimicrobiales bacterium]
MGGDGQAADVRVGFWNTWLLAPRLWSGGPRLPDLGNWFGRDVAERAPLVARALAGRFDVAALSEVFEQSEHAAIADAWPEADLIAGPQRRGLKVAGSGLATLVDRTRADVVFVARHQYRSGGDFRDSDTFASKGALLTTVRMSPDLPDLDVVSTHLIAGGDLLPIPGHDDQVRHHRARMAQADELVDFVTREHDPDNVLLVVGDFNVVFHDPDPSLADPRSRYEDLSARLTAIGLEDVWLAHGSGPGDSCSFARPTDLPPADDDPDAVADDPEADPATSPGERIDYVWLRRPAGVLVDVARPRRWAFPGRGPQGGRAGSLSDHLAVSTTLTLHPRR